MLPLICLDVDGTLVGSIGLVASVPITTALAVWVVRHERRASPRGLGWPDEDEDDSETPASV